MALALFRWKLRVGITLRHQRRRRIDTLRGDEVSLADQRRMPNLFGDHHQERRARASARR